MPQTATQQLYEHAERRIEELLPLVTDDTPLDDPKVTELTQMSDLVEQYETLHYPIHTSSDKRRH